VTIARNTAKDKLRCKEEQMKQRLCPEDSLMLMPAKAHRTDSIGIKSFVMKLRPECQVIIELIYFQGYTIADIANLLYLPEGTVKTRVREGLKSLRRSYSAQVLAVA
jgi:RNA polymerase sigma-70 factor (ECF subfamily)